MGTGRQYDKEFKKQIVLFAKEIGNASAVAKIWAYGTDYDRIEYIFEP